MPNKKVPLPPVSRLPSAAPSPIPAFLREKQVLESLPISKSTLWRLVAAGKLEVLRISQRATLFKAQSVLDYLADCEQKGKK